MHTTDFEELSVLVGELKTKLTHRWTSDKPTEKGWYWFYGWVCRERPSGKAPAFMAVKVIMVGRDLDQPLIIMDGHFISAFEPLEGWFSPMIVPDTTPVHEFSPTNNDPIGCKCGEIKDHKSHWNPGDPGESK